MDSKSQSEQRTDVSSSSTIQNFVFGPGYTYRNHPGGIQSLSTDQQIEWFYKSVSVWLLDFAEKLADMPDSGFAVLAILNPYPEMIAQLSGVEGKKLFLFEQGMLSVFPSLADDPNKASVCEHLYSHFRSSLAHMALTGSNVILSDIPTPLAWEISGGNQTVVINPKLWAKHIREHLESYVVQLRNSNNTELRKCFSERLQNPF